MPEQMVPCLRAQEISSFRYVTFLETMRSASSQFPCAHCTSLGLTVHWPKGRKEGRDLRGLQLNAWDVATSNAEGKMSPGMRTGSH